MKFDYQAFKTMITIAIGISILIVIIGIPGCFNTPSKGSPNIIYMLISVCFIMAIALILINKYL